jgi:uncharacterized protein
MQNKWMHIVSVVLVIVGGLNWGLIGLFDFNLVNIVLGSLPVAERIVYILVGLAAVYIAATHSKDCKVCSAMKEQKAVAM